MLKIKKGDKVILISGDVIDKYQTDKDGKKVRKVGKVLQVLPTENKAIVEGFNIAKKHNRPKGEEKKGTITQIEKPIHISNLSLVDAKTLKPFKVGFSVVDGKKVRIDRKTKKVID